jgi:hypothetical protein
VRETVKGHVFLNSKKDPAADQWQNARRISRTGEVTKAENKKFHTI